jgi:hypothetical protein
LTAAQVRVHGARLDRAGPDEGDLVGEVLEGARAHDARGVDLAGALDLEEAHGGARSDDVPDARIVGKPVEVDPFALRAQDLLAGALERREHAQPEEIELDQAERLGVVLVELQQLDAAARALQGAVVREWVAREHDAAAVGREMAGVARLHAREQIEQGLLGGGVAEDLVEGGRGLPGAPRREVAVVAAERARELRTLLGWDPQRAPEVLDGEREAVGDLVGDHRLGGGAEALLDPRQQLVAAGGGDVDVDVGHRALAGVQEALEQQVVLDGVGAGDAEQVAADGGGGGAAAGGEDAVPTAVVGDLGGHQEEVGQAEGADGGELLLELEPRLREALPLVALEQRLVAAALEVLGRGEAGGHARPRRHQPLGEQVEGGALGHPVGVEVGLGEGEAALDLVGRRERAGLVLRPLGVGVVDGDAEAGAGQRVEQAVVRGPRMPHLGRGHDGEADVLGEAAQHAGAAAVPGEAVVEELHVEALREGALELAHAAIEFRDLPARQEAGRQAVARAGEAHEVVRVRQQHGPGHDGRRGRVGVRDQFVQGGVARAGGREQHQRHDVAVVELDRDGRADQRLQAVLAGRLEQLHRARDVEEVGERQAAVAELGGAPHQGRGGGGAGAEGEGRAGAQQRAQPFARDTHHRPSSR